MSGYIKIHRQIIDWEWYQDSNVVRLFLHLLLTVNYKDKKWKGITIKRGSTITGLEKLSKECGLSMQQTRTALSKLKSTNEITNETSPRGSVISIVKYNSYQIATNETTSNQQTSNKQSNKQVTTTKEGKERKERKEYNIDVQNLIDFWNTNSRQMAKIKSISHNRLKSVKARIDEHGLQELKKALQLAGESSFLNGNNDRRFMASFDWVIKPNNFIKVLEGNYSNRKPKNVNNGLLHGQ